ncbi:beta-ketoacyl-ACP synthase III [Streptomyces lasiicapitis]|uniref:Beta-ketoacyl-[acyl-carrier-protein] synthase III n=1 Tax=Streptomyces lasiicapitis TaxID=1923961 RepID=A0ABQ2LKB0_9ACTN|nr:MULTISPECIES: beta-ketoacyl-ACP synthase III [Streptomyces]QIB42393.1 ketoacyl-ACP synthase III [Streptomyces aureoverticillatus]GGO37512.1 3-oxoacyl-[acyl-carrier-protein] synthase 3 protein 3 [Streptomyces lasiicapitis]
MTAPPPSRPAPHRAAVLTGVGGCLPPTAVSNDELAARLDSSDAWIRSRTGIRQRYFASPGTATSDLAVGAGARALKSSGTPDVDAVLLATTTPDRPCPATAPAVAARLGLTGTAAFDVSAVCTGFVYALATAAGLIATCAADRVLVIGAETFSTLLDPDDRSTSVIFGDGAGAVVLRAGDAEEPGALGPFDLGSDGGREDLITVAAGGSRQRLSGVAPKSADRYFAMAGKDVFRHAVQRMSASARAVLARAGWEPGDVDHLVGHQANLRITNHVADEVGIPRARCFSNIADVGNTAAASIPLALDQAHADGVLRAGGRVLLTAFGGGLTWGSTVLTWPELDRP